MIPIRFGTATRPLTGFYHPPTQSGDRARSVLLCNPFGQEAIRCHRLIKLLAERLARKGFSVIRFDYFATGNSLGEDNEANLDGWVDDTLRADQELAKLAAQTLGADTKNVSWLGLRLGAAVAARASAKRALTLDKLALWDPVVEGTHYLSELALAHDAAMQSSYGIRYLVDKNLRKIFSTEAGTEALGFPLSAHFKAQIGALTPDLFANTNAARIDVFGANVVKSSDAKASSPTTSPALATVPTSTAWSDLISILQANKISHQFFPLTSEFVWTANEMMNASVVPADILETIVNQVSSPS